MQQTIFQQLEALGIDTRKGNSSKDQELLGNSPEKSRLRKTAQDSLSREASQQGFREEALRFMEDSGREEYLEKLKCFITGYDFMRLGQAVNRGQWESAHMTLRRMNQMSQELGLNCMMKWYGGLREALSGRDIVSAKQILAQMTQKRLQIRKILLQ